ncbi:MAG: serine hydrolase, partial [Planctomycetota bacterium]|nr:serine hydrolase [Planctomycetota bacterium]
MSLLRPRTRTGRLLLWALLGIAALTWLPLRGWDSEPYGILREDGAWTERGSPRLGLSLRLAADAAQSVITTARGTANPRPRRLWITAIEDHPLLQELATRLVDSLRDDPHLEEVGWFPANTQPLQVRRAPDAWLVLELAELESLSLPLYQHLRTEVHLTLDHGLAERAVQRSLPPAWSALAVWDCASWGIVSEAARWDHAAEALTLALDLPSGLEELDGPAEPSLAARAAYPPPPPADLAEALEPLGSILWTTPTAGGRTRTRWVLEPPLGPSELGATLEALGFGPEASIQSALLRWERGDERVVLRVLGANQPLEGIHVVPWQPERAPEVRFMEFESSGQEVGSLPTRAVQGELTPAASLLEEVAGLLARASVDKTTPCAVAAWGQLFEPRLTLASGALTYDEGSPTAGAATLFDLASLTKVVSSTTLALLHERRGTWSLEDPLVDHLPAFAGEDRRRAEVRLHHLLRHTSGLPAWRPLYREHEGRDAVVAAAAATALERAPGVEREYSDLGLILLGAALEAATGRSLDALEREEIFEPLSMSTATRTPGFEGVAPTEVPAEGEPAWFGVVHDENARAAGGVVGHAGLFASAHDLGRFAEEWLSAARGEGSVLEPADLERVRSSGGDAPWLGWRSMDEDRPSILHHTGFTGTALWIDPEGGRFALL